MCDQGQMISLSYKQADPSYTVDSGTRVTFPRAGPLARMLLGAKQRGRPRIVSRIIVEEYVAL
jgi:hypothetical protein